MTRNVAVTSDELQVIWDDFKSFDKDQKGYLDKSELQELLAKQLNGVVMTDGQFTELYTDVFDTNGDDKVYFEEYTCAIHGAEWLEILPSTQSTEPLGWDGVFKAGSDVNDQMSKAAFRRIKRLIAGRGVTSRAPEGMKLIDQHFESIDTNDDGLLSFQEFHAMIEQWTKSLPTLPATNTEPETTPAIQEAAILTALSSVSQDPEKSIFMADNRKGRLADEEILSVDYVFNKIDKDDSGKISYSEFLNFRHEFYHGVDDTQIIEEVYHADKNHDDAIDKEEFRGIMKSFKASLARSNLGGKFFRNHLNDLVLDHWNEDDTAEHDLPPIHGQVRSYAQIAETGSNWHSMGGDEAMKQQVREFHEKKAIEDAKPKPCIKQKESGRKEKAVKYTRVAPKRAKVHSDFNFSQTFASKRATLGLNY